MNLVERGAAEGTAAENVSRSIEAMELLLCTLGFLWLTSTSADHILPQRCHTHKQCHTGVCVQHGAFQIWRDMWCIGTELRGLKEWSERRRQTADRRVPKLIPLLGLGATTGLFKCPSCFYSWHHPRGAEI